MSHRLLNTGYCDAQPRTPDWIQTVRYSSDYTGRKDRWQASFHGIQAAVLIPGDDLTAAEHRRPSGASPAVLAVDSDSRERGCSAGGVFSRDAAGR